MNIACYLVSNGEFVKSAIPEELVLKLAKSLRTNGTETIHFADHSIDVEGIYIPGKGSNTSLMLIPNVE